MEITNTADYAKRLYGKEELSYNSKAEKVRLRKIAALVGSGHKVLDVGCWDGTLGSMLIQRGNDVYGIEVNKEVSEIAKKRGINVKVQDVELGFDFEDGFFDVVVAAEIIEHILDTDFFIGNVKKTLKPHGFLVLTTPNVASIGRRILLLLGKNPYFEASFGYPPNAHAGHIRFFTKDLLINYLSFKGFKVTDFMSDVVNFASSGKMTSESMADIFPTLGRSLIIKARLI